MVGSSNTASHNTVCVTEAAPEVDEFELGQESDNPPVGGNYCHVNESKYDIISLAIERYGLTNNLNQAGYILPNGSLLNFGKDGYREEDHRGIEGIYKSNNIPIWNNEYRYNYVVDFMNHGAIRCCLNGGILDMTKEPTAQQYSIIKAFVRNAVDIDIDFTDDKGNTLHSVSYMDAKPSQVVGDIYRYYNEGIKPIGNVHYESKNRIKELMESIDFDEHGMYLNNEKMLGKYNLKDLILSKNGNYVTLNKIVANKLGNGFGSKFMSDLVRIADKNGWTLALTPDMSFGASSVGRLKKFYKRFGFIPNKGRKADFNTRETMIRKPITENIDFEVNSSDIDLSSFRKRDQLAPIWNEEGELNPRIRLKLLDIADDFWEFVNLKWVKPNGIILTGSICNFNWSQYSDVDLHLIVDFDEIDEKTEFVRDYLDAKKNEWNNEHEGLKILDYPVELYVQNLGEMPQSGGIYDLEENDWIKKGNPENGRIIHINCNDGNGSGCVRERFSRTWPNDYQQDAEWGYIQVRDNAGNVSVTDAVANSTNICDANANVQDKCRVRVNVDKHDPSIKVIGAYKADANGKIADQTNHFNTANKTWTDSTGDGSIGYTEYNNIGDNAYWFNGDEYPNGVVYKIEISDNIHLDTWSWATNGTYVTNTTGSAYTAYNTGNDRYASLESTTNWKENCGTKSKVILVGFKGEGKRKGLLTVKDKAGNDLKLSIEANIDRTDPPVPNEVDYTGGSDGIWAKNNIVIKARNAYKRDDMSGPNADTKIELSGWNYFQHKVIKDYDTSFKYEKKGQDFTFNKDYEGQNKIQYLSCDKALNCTEYGKAWRAWVDFTPPKCIVKRDVDATVTGSNNWVGKGSKVTVTSDESLTIGELTTSIK